MIAFHFDKILHLYSSPIKYDLRPVCIFKKSEVLKVSEVVFKSKLIEHCWNSNNIYLLKDTSLKIVILEDFKLEIEIVLFA
jgi:hypothetical protein